MVRVGLCCTFLEEPIKFRHTTAKHVSTLAKRERLPFLRTIALHNAAALGDAIRWCHAHGVGAFRVLSQLLPLYTHPDHRWTIDGELQDALRAVGALRAELGIRLSFHPDQFVVPGSASPHVVESSLQELEYQAEVAELIGAEQITLHGGGAQPTKAAALARFELAFARLSPRARSRVVLENDDRVYTVEDLLPTCERLGIPLVYDVHHHRCNPDELSVEEATDRAAATWHGREPWVHLSSPAAGWKSGDPRPHADFIAPADVPKCWRDRAITIDVEAKSKELAVLDVVRRFRRSPRRRA